MKPRKFRKGKDRPEVATATTFGFRIPNNDEEWEYVSKENITAEEWQRGKGTKAALSDNWRAVLPYWCPLPQLAPTGMGVQGGVLLNQQGVVRLPKFSCYFAGYGRGESENFVYGPFIEKAIKRSNGRDHATFPFATEENIQNLLDLTYNAEDNKRVFSTYWQQTDFNLSRVPRELFKAREVSIETADGNDAQKLWNFYCETKDIRQYLHRFFPIGSGSVIHFKNDYSYEFEGTVIYLKDGFFYQVSTIEESDGYRVNKGNIFEPRLEEEHYKREDNSDIQVPEEFGKFSTDDEDYLMGYGQTSKFPNEVGRYRKVGEWVDESPESLNYRESLRNCVSYELTTTVDAVTEPLYTVYTIKGKDDPPIVRSGEVEVYLDELGLIPINDGYFEVDLKKRTVEVRGSVLNQGRQYVENGIYSLKDIQTKGWQHYPVRSHLGKIAPQPSNNLLYGGFKDGTPNNLKFHYIPNKRWCVIRDNKIKCTRMIMMGDVYTRMTYNGEANYSVPSDQLDVRRYFNDRSLVHLLTPWEALGIDAGTEIDISWFPIKFRNRMNTFMPSVLFGGHLLDARGWRNQELIAPYTDNDYYHSTTDRNTITPVDELSKYVRRLEFFFMDEGITQNGLEVPIVVENKFISPHLTKAWVDVIKKSVDLSRKLTEMERRLFQYVYPAQWSSDYRELAYGGKLGKPYIHLGFHWQMMPDSDAFFVSDDAVGSGSDKIFVRNVPTDPTGTDIHLEEIEVDELLLNSRGHFDRDLTFNEKLFIHRMRGLKDTGLSNEVAWKLFSGLTINKDTFNAAIELPNSLFYRYEMEIGTNVTVENYQGYQTENQYDLEFIGRVYGIVRHGGYDKKFKLPLRLRWQNYGHRNLIGKIGVLSPTNANDTFWMGDTWLERGFTQSDLSKSFADGLQLMNPEDFDIKKQPMMDFHNLGISAFCFRNEWRGVIKTSWYPNPLNPNGGNKAGISTDLIPYLDWTGDPRTSRFIYPNEYRWGEIGFRQHNSGLRNNFPSKELNVAFMLLVSSARHVDLRNGVQQYGICDERGLVIKPNSTLQDVLDKNPSAFFPPFNIMLENWDKFREQQRCYLYPNQLAYFRPDMYVETLFPEGTPSTNNKVMNLKNPYGEGKIKDKFSCTPKEFCERYTTEEERKQSIFIQKDRSKKRIYFFPFKSGFHQTETIELRGIARNPWRNLPEFTYIDGDFHSCIWLSKMGGLMTGSGLFFNVRENFKEMDSFEAYRLCKNFGIDFGFGESPRTYRKESDYFDYTRERLVTED